MKNRKCPSRKACLDYDNGNCQNCVFGEKIITLHRRIDRLKKQNETLTIQRNAWALAAKAVKEDTVRKMQERLKADAVTIRDHTGKLGVVVGVGNIDDVAREMLEGENER